MIIYQGITSKNNVYFLKLLVDDKTVSIPIDTHTAFRINEYLKKYVPPVLNETGQEDEEL